MKLLSSKFICVQQIFSSDYYYHISNARKTLKGNQTNFEKFKLNEIVFTSIYYANEYFCQTCTQSATCIIDFITIHISNVIVLQQTKQKTATKHQKCLLTFDCPIEINKCK